MPLRALAFALLVFATPFASAQEVMIGGSRRKTEVAPAPLPAVNAPRTAWLDLRQNTTGKPGPQSAPAWVKAVTMLPQAAKEGVAAKTTFRIQLTQPSADLPLLMFRLFFDDKPEQRPRLLASDNDGGLVLQTTPLGLGLSLATSETVMVPAAGVSTVDVEVPGDGRTIRGAYLDWMTSGEVVRPADADPRYVMAETFDAEAPLRAGTADVENFGTVTATLAPETISIGPSVQQGAAFQFPLEAQPLAAMLTFEVSSAYIDSLPEVYLNGENLGQVTVSLPELADPAYRGEMKPLMRQMRFQYTGWLRAQKILPASSLHTGPNDLLVIAGAGTPASAIRATQIQLKYVWEKFDYQLIPGR
ncbi:MAG: hypothetical protein M3Y69_02360 [Verrucomicrobiota bacterium]|nr:hypothetical protein [Verrucomicrobiota bacterium]